MPKLRKRLTITALVALVARCWSPAVGQARDQLRQPAEKRADRTPATCEAFGACTLVSFIHPSDPEGDPYSGGAPVDGVITKFRIRAYADRGPGQVTFRVGRHHDPTRGLEHRLGDRDRRGHRPDGDDQPDEAALETPITEVAGRLPVKKGQHLAIDASQIDLGDLQQQRHKFSYVFAPPLVEGAGPRGSTEATDELLVAATIEPDADRDGFGDETQDRCPSQATTQGACDDTKPGVQGLRVENGTITYSLSRGGDRQLPAREKAAGPQGRQKMRQADAEKQNQKTLRRSSSSVGDLRRHRQRRRNRSRCRTARSSSPAPTC